MNKLASRMTYLGFGVLVGSSVCAGFYKYFNGDFDFTITLQILISAAAVIAAGLSAYAAYQAATITKATHDNALELRSVRVSSAKRIISNTLDSFQKGKKEQSKSIQFKNIEQYRVACQLIDRSLSEPIDEDKHIALWNAHATIHQMCVVHDENGNIPADRMDWFIDQLTKCLAKLG